MKKIPIQHDHPAAKSVALYANEGKQVIEVKKGDKVKYYHSIAQFVRVNNLDPKKYERRKFPFVENKQEFNKKAWNEI